MIDESPVMINEYPGMINEYTFYNNLIIIKTYLPTGKKLNSNDLNSQNIKR